MNPQTTRPANPGPVVTAASVLSRRSSGVLLHITSLPGPWGIGDFGPQARAFVQFLHATGQQLWEVLPLCPTGYGDSPYQGLSAFAGNPNLISPDDLLADGLLDPSDLAGLQPFPEGPVDYGSVIPFKRALLERAFARYLAGGAVHFVEPLAGFRASQAEWLEDYALFVSLKEAHGGSEWTAWSPELARREPQALNRARQSLAAQIDYHIFAQFLFFRQWLALKEYANRLGVKVIGDIPIFMGHDSADVWANQDLFFMDENGRLSVVAGAPPDFFLTEGQLWGNPLYRWDLLEARGYDWWIRRFRMGLEQADILRLDHFRGFAAYWEIPGDATSAAVGQWAQGPGAGLFVAAARALGPLPLIAEDLGLITEDVHALREELGYPGMKVLHEAFHGDSTNIYLPHNYTPDFAVYTGTHDMFTTRGWWENLQPEIKHRARIYMGRSGEDIVWDMIRLAFASVASLAILPMQDLLELDNSARMNAPGVPAGNWAWRYRSEQITPQLVERLRTFTDIYGRAPAPAPAPVQEAQGKAADDTGATVELGDL